MATYRFSNRFIAVLILCVSIAFGIASGPVAGILLAALMSTSLLPFAHTQCLGLTFTPAIIFGPVAMSATPGTSLKTGTAGHNYIMRTIDVLVTSAASSKTFTLSIGADAAGTRIFDQYTLAAQVPAIFNGWWLFVGAGAHDVDGNCSATPVTISAFGYDQTP